MRINAADNQRAAIRQECSGLPPRRCNRRHQYCQHQEERPASRLHYYVPHYCALMLTVSEPVELCTGSTTIVYVPVCGAVCVVDHGPVPVQSPPPGMLKPPGF